MPRSLASKLFVPRLMACQQASRKSTVRLWRHSQKIPSPCQITPYLFHGDNLGLRRSFHTESEFHTIADETLEGIQDAVDETLEDEGIPDFEVTFASGVLTLVFPPHGTWVINKQTPNKQLWWSSPISGPRRYEYEDGEWVFTRDDSHSMTLSQTLSDEVLQIYNVDISFD